MLGTWDIVWRIVLAAMVGGAIGLNRNLHHKYVGLRTMALIGGSAAALTIIALNGADGQIHVEAMSRIIQGILTGLGFIGAGVIVRGAEGKRVHGLTTAATVWTTAVLGILCGNGAWVVVLTLGAVTAAILVLGGPTERAAHRLIDRMTGPAGTGEKEPHKQA